MLDVVVSESAARGRIVGGSQAQQAQRRWEVGGGYSLSLFHSIIVGYMECISGNIPIWLSYITYHNA